MKSLTKNNDGFISIIAIGVFALLMIFAISLQVTVIDTLQNLKNGVNYDQARDVADSTMEYLQWKIKSHEAGWNTGNVVCGFGGAAAKSTTEGGGITGFCQDPGLLALVNPGGGQAQKNIEMILEVKGRSGATDALKSAKCGAGACYVTPIPGTGDAGKNCAMYKPNSTGTTSIDPSLNNGVVVDQVDYTCNWNKLVFGSNQTDRVAVPLYYDNSGLSGQSSVVNPYMDPSLVSKFTGTSAATNTATKLVVRLRTPCKPCATASSESTRECGTTPVDESLCEDKDRYQLDAGDPVKDIGDDIVVQWTISGECDAGGGKTEACGVMPIPKGGKDGKGKSLDDYVSALYESKILSNNNTNLNSYNIIGNDTLAYDSNNYPTPVYLLSPSSPGGYSINKLTAISKPILALFLSKPILTPNKSNIPYLEYQVLTDQPIGNTKSSFDVTVNVEGNSFRKTLTQDVQKALIDFAIHN